MGIVYETKWSGIHAWRRVGAGLMHQHMHDYAEMIYVQKGEMCYSVNFKEYTLRAGDVIFAFPNQIHGHPPVPNDTVNFVLLFPKDLPFFDGVLSDLIPESPLLSGAVDAQTDALFLQAATVKPSSYRKGITLGYIALILGKLLPALTLKPAEHGEGSVEQRLIEYCSLHYTEPITLAAVAEALGYSATHLSHLFSSKFKIGFSAFIAAMRMEDAKKLLRGEKPVTEIALECGFGSMRNFNRVFKANLGITPSEYRKQNRQ